MPYSRSSGESPTLLIALVLVGVTMLVAAVLSAASAGAATLEATGGSSECARYASVGVDVSACEDGLDQARTATARYANVANAVADGFVPFTGCEQDPSGAMGQHWARPDRMVTPRLKPATPAILLYAPSATGLRLVAVEYEANALVDGLPYYGLTPPDPSRVMPAPSMFGGQKFNGPMQGHNPIQPWHYDLHVWIWASNPNGVFAQFNPAIHC